MNATSPAFQPFLGVRPGSLSPSHPRLAQIEYANRLQTNSPPPAPPPFPSNVFGSRFNGTKEKRGGSLRRVLYPCIAPPSAELPSRSSRLKFSRPSFPADRATPCVRSSSVSSTRRIKRLPARHWFSRSPFHPAVSAPRLRIPARYAACRPRC